MLTSRTAHRTLTSPTESTLVDGTRVVVRGAGAADLPEVAAMHARCSLLTIKGRYPGAQRAPGRRLLERLVCSDVALVALTPRHQVSGIANLAVTEEDEDVAELAVLVEDGWQHRGVGATLLRQAVGAARGLGFEEVYGIAPTAGSWAEYALGRLGRTLAQQTPFGEVVVRLRLSPHHLALLGAPAAS